MVTRARKIYFTLLAVLWLATGCSFDSGRVQLLNWNWFGTPDKVTVQRGDTLYSISKRYNVPLRDLIEINNLTPPYTLIIGRQLRLPTAKFHTVAKGDTLYNISKRYGVDVTTLSRVNHLQAPYTLSIGQRLALPGSVSGGEVHTPAPVKTATVSKYRKSKFAWPLQGTVISHYGTIGKGRNNDGINIKAKLGAAVKAADAGRVAYAGNELKGFGNLILIKHNDGWITAYAHNDRLFVKKGQKVKKGEKIAAAGSTGSVNTPQLHFEIRSGTKALNPLNYLPK